MTRNSRTKLSALLSNTHLCSEDEQLLLHANAFRGWMPILGHYQRCANGWIFQPTAQSWCHVLFPLQVLVLLSKKKGTMKKTMSLKCPVRLGGLKVGESIITSSRHREQTAHLTAVWSCWSLGAEGYLRQFISPFYQYCYILHAVGEHQPTWKEALT